MRVAIGLLVALAASANAQEPRVMAYPSTYLTWPASEDTLVNGYFILRQDGDESSPLELVGMSYDAADLVTLPRCKPARFAIREMHFDPWPNRYGPQLPDEIVTTREPGPWMVYCGDPDLNGDGRVSASDTARQQSLFGRHLDGDEWIR